MAEQSSLAPLNNIPIKTIQMPSLPTMAEIDSISAICRIAAQSNFVNSSAPMSNQTQRMADAFFVVMMGRELGISAMMALKTIFVIEGKPSCSGQALLSLMRRAGVEVEVPDPATITTSATVRVKRPGGEWHSYTYTEDMAKQAGLLSRNIWGKYKREMLLWRAVSTANRFETPDITGGMYTIEEIAPPNLELNAEGDIVSGALAAPSSPSTTSIPASTGNVIVDSKAWLNDVQFLIDRALKAFDGITTADIQKYVGFTDLKDISEAGWGQYPDAKTAGLAIKEGFEADLKKIAEEPPAQPKTAAAPSAPSATPASPFGKNAHLSTKTHEWTDEEISALEEYAASHWFDTKFGKGMDTIAVLESLKINAWSDVVDPKVAKDAITSYMSNHHVAIIANKVKFVKAGKGGYAALSNGEVVVRLYGRDMIRNLGPNWAEYVEAWEANEEYIFAEDEMPNLVVEWEPKLNEKGDLMYNNAILITLPLESVPAATW